MTARWSVDLIFGNLGRAPSPELVDRTHRAFTRRARQMLEQGRTVFVAFVELDEGDRGYDDWAILDEHWTAPWRALHRGARETLIYSATRSEIESTRTLRAGLPVKRQSPPRPVHRDRFEETAPEDPQVTGLTWHSAAGAKNGWRAKLARRLLLDSWYATRRRARRAARKARKRGDHVIYMADVNDRGWKPLTRHETAKIQHGPDVIAVIPAPGWDARLDRQLDIANAIEPGLHPGLHARATFTRKPDRKEPR